MIDLFQKRNYGDVIKEAKKAGNFYYEEVITKELHIYEIYMEKFVKEESLARETTIGYVTEEEDAKKICRNLNFGSTYESEEVTTKYKYREIFIMSEDEIDNYITKRRVNKPLYVKLIYHLSDKKKLLYMEYTYSLSSDYPEFYPVSGKIEIKVNYIEVSYQIPAPNVLDKIELERVLCLHGDKIIKAHGYEFIRT